MVFIRFQYHLQRHFVVLVVAGLVVDITIMQAPIAIHRFMFIPMVLQDLSVGLLQVPNKQWGFTNNTGRPYITFPFKFSNVFTAISCICHNGSPSEANTVYNVSISGMNIGASGGGSGKYWCAFGVAQQQWGYSTGGSGAWALKFNGVYTAVVVGAPGFPAREFCGFTFDYTLTGWSFTAGYNSPISYIRPTTTAISLGY